MAIEAKVLADSVAPNGRRLTTQIWTYPRSIHSEIMTHRAFSRNAASSRAIPTEKLIQRVIDDPWIPSYIGKNQKGMQAGEELSEDQQQQARYIWLAARDEAVERARQLVGMGCHKQVVNRIIEPWMWITVIVSATEWENFFGLRDHPMAEPHFQELARAARAARDASTPRKLAFGEWHLPLIDCGRADDDTGSPDGRAIDEQYKPATIAQVKLLLAKISVGRCARVSYLTHAGRRDISEDIALHDRLVGQVPLHASPTEHVAYAHGETHGDTWSGNFRGWVQYRKTLPNENLDATGGLYLREQDKA